MQTLAERFNGEVVPVPVPSPKVAFTLASYHWTHQDAVFFDILAEELARRDMDYVSHFRSEL